MAIAIKKTAAIAIAAGLTFAGSAGIAAQDALAQLPAAPDAQTVNTAKTASINIHKKVNPTTYGEATGQPDNTVSGEGLDGVGFTVYRITQVGDTEINDVSDQAQYNALAEFSHASNLTFNGDFTEVTGDLNGKKIVAKVAQEGTEQTTVNGGEAAFSNLQLGGYVVRETALPTKANTAYVPAKPFVAVVPTTQTVDGQSAWDYSIDVYPKNGETTVTKSVKDLTLDEGNQPTEATNVKSDISYTVTGTVPAAPSGEYLKSFVVEDNYDSAELEVKSRTVKVQVIGADGKTSRDLGDADYKFATQGELSQNPKHSGAVAQGANAGWTVTINDPFKLVPGETVKVTIDATVKSAADNLVENSARTFGTTGKANPGFQPGPSNTTTPTPPTTPGTPPDEPDTPWDTPDTKVKSYFGDIKIEKYADDLKDDPATAEKNERGLEGAEFDIFRCKADDDGAMKLVGDKAVQSVKTDENGYATFSGLHVTNFANNVALVEDEQFDYCLKETKAPNGYALNPNIIKVNERLETSTAEDGKTVQVKAVSQAISNTKKTTPTLPATGGMGVLIIALAGLAIIGGGVYAARRNSQSA